MRKVRVKALRESLLKILPDPTKQQWRAYKSNYWRGYVTKVNGRRVVQEST